MGRLLTPSLIPQPTIREEVLYSYKIPDEVDFPNGTSRVFDSDTGKHWVIESFMWDEKSPKMSMQKTYAIVDGKFYANDERGAVHMDWEKEHIAFTVRSGGKSRIYLDHKLVAESNNKLERVMLDKAENTIFFKTSQAVYKVADGKVSRHTGPDPFELKTNGPEIKIIKRGLKKVLFKDGEEVDSAIWIESEKVSPDGKRLAYWKCNDGKLYQLMINGKAQSGVLCNTSGVVAAVTRSFLIDEKMRDYPCGDLEFSPDSKRYYCMAHQGYRVYLYTEKGLLDSNKSMPFNLTYSPDGRHVGYTMYGSGGSSSNYRHMESHAKVDGKDLNPGKWSKFLCFSPDSKRYASVRTSRYGKERVVVNGKQVGRRVDKVDDIGCNSSFSLDNKHFCYATMDPAYIVIDGQRTVPQHNLILSDVTWHKGYITYWAMDNPSDKHSTSIGPGAILKFIKCKIPE